MEFPANKELIDQIYCKLNKNANALYEFVMLYHDYIYQAKDYGNGDKIKMVEVHTLTMIEDNPGITVTQLAKLWNRTKGTVSVNVALLEKKGYIYSEKSSSNTKIIHLYATEKGVELSTAHKIYDILDIMQTQAELLKVCTHEELDCFFKVLATYLDLFQSPESGKDTSAGR